MLIDKYKIHKFLFFSLLFFVGFISIGGYGTYLNQQAEYLIINTTYAFMYSQVEYQQVKKEYSIVKQITSYGNTICEIYKKK